MSFIDYSNIIGYVEDKINIINTLPANEAALVAAMANLLAGRNNPPSNMLALEAYLQGKENLVTDADLVKDVTLLLGASLPSKNTVWKSQEFLVTDVWNRPLNLAGNTVWLTGCAGGGSGGKGGFYASGGYGGAYCQRRPVTLPANTDVFNVTIPEGGAANSVNGVGNNGGDLTFGSILTLKGGSGGKSFSGTPSNVEAALYADGFGVRPLLYVDGASPGFSIHVAETVNGNISGRSIAAGAFFTGGAAGLFGSGTGATNSTNSAAAPVNSGAGSGASRTGNSGAGGSGRLIVEWQEFV